MMEPRDARGRGAAGRPCAMLPTAPFKRHGFPAEKRHTMDTVRREVDERSVELYQQRWVAWPVAWSAVWVGALLAFGAGGWVAY